MKFRIESLVVAIAVLSSFHYGFLSSSLAADAGKPLELKLGTINTASSPDGQGVVRFKENVEKKSDGKIKINIFHDSALGPTAAQVEGVMMGTQDMIATGTGLFEQFAPDIKAPSVLYLFRDDDHLQKFVLSPAWKRIETELRGKGFVFINKKMNWITGPYRVLVIRNPVRTLDDLKGMKLRMPEVKTLQEGWRHLGANVVTLPWSETYLALSQKIVDGLECPISIVRPNKFTEIVKYIINVNTFPQRFVLAMNAKKMDSLSPEQQKMLIDSADEAGEHYTQAVRKGADVDVKLMIEKDGAKVIDIDRTPWIEKMKPFYEKLESTGFLRKGLVQEIQSLR